MNVRNNNRLFKFINLPFIIFTSRFYLFYSFDSNPTGNKLKSVMNQYFVNQSENVH